MTFLLKYDAMLEQFCLICGDLLCDEPATVNVNCGASDKIILDRKNNGLCHFGRVTRAVHQMGLCDILVMFGAILASLRLHWRVDNAR